MMEVNYRESSSPLQDWQLNECNQDFRQGAKGSNSLFHPVSFPTAINSSLYDGPLDEWMENRETLGYGGLEAFDDVILPDEQECELNLYQDHVEDNKYTHSIFKASDDFDILAGQPSYTTYDSLVCEQRGSETNESKVTIKLKKIKVPKKSNQNNFNDYMVCDYDLLANTPPQVDRSPSPPAEIILSESKQENEVFTFDTDIEISEFSEELVHTWDNTNLDKLLDEENFNFEEQENVFELDNSSDVLTLKDALNMENADFILENYLSPRSIKSHELSLSISEHWTNSHSLEPVIEEIFSPSETSTQYSYSEGIPSPSPSNSENYSEESVLPTVYSLDGVLDLPSPNKFRQAKRRREKMSPESRYLRKKEQNKQAALRYRAKKKKEDEQLSNTLNKEEERHEKLGKENSRLRQEVEFMKKLLREAFIAKKLVPPNAFD